MKLSTTLQKLFDQEIAIKYQVYDSLFTNLPYEKIDNTGMLLPLLLHNCRKGLENDQSPKEIIEDFFLRFAYISDEKDQLDFLFFVIQYVERQIVLFDSIEDAAFENISKYLPIGTFENLYDIARQRNIRQQVKEKLQSFKVRVVFTAHPTQFYSNDVLLIIADFEKAIKSNDIGQIAKLIKQLSKTPFINKKKPTPLEEARSIMYYLRFIYYDTIGILNEKLHEYFFETIDEFSPVVELGFWPGGDRDGNPFVTAETTQKVAEELRYDILRCYYEDVKKLKKRLTFRNVKEKIAKLRDHLYENIFAGRNDITYDGIVSMIMDIRKTIIEEHNSLFLEEVDFFLRKVKTFGLHFASLDIRQDSSKHEQIFDAVVEKNGYANGKYSELSEEKKIEVLLNKQTSIFPDIFDDAVLQDTIINIRQLKDIQRKNGEKSIHRYIISNSTTACSVLEVFALFRYCDYKEEEIAFDIVPLFETIEGLNAACDVMEQLYTNPTYKQHIKRRNNKQTIMLGFSDGTKDGGYVKANWSIYNAKKSLTDLSRKYGVDVVFFDGRGGPPARGGGKTHQFYASQGDAIAGNEIQVTIQGQTISSQYGSVPQALYNFEQLVTAGVLTSFKLNSNTVISDEGKELITELGEIAYQKYLTLKENPLFLPYLEKKSALKYYGDTNIGSRPSKRGTKNGLKLTDLRAIPFVGSWSQLKQNIPGYFGFGTAIQKLIEQGKKEQLQQLYKQSLYFKTLMQNSMMSLAKTYFPLTSYLKKDKEFGEFWNILHEEYLLSVKNLLEVSQEKELMEKEVLSKLSIAHREQIVLPLLVIQQYALQKLEEGVANEAVYEKVVMRSLFGNINASRNSA